MKSSKPGLPTYHTRVERWECDYNDHWNVRFYGRSFQMAAETIAVHGNRPNPGSATTHCRHLRFHRELMVSAPVEVRSASLAGTGGLQGAIVHQMWSGDTLAATALDLPGGAGHLPSVEPEEVEQAMPRGITDPVALDGPGKAPVTAVELGPIRSEDIDHRGLLRFETLLRHSSNIQHMQFNALGLTPEFAAANRINRMGVEFRVTRGMSPPAGDGLQGQTWATRVEGKAFWATTRIASTRGEMVANIEMCVLTVDLDTRKAVPVPAFMHRALER